MVATGLALLFPGIAFFIASLTKPLPEGPNEYLIYGGTRGLREVARNKHIWRPVSVLMIVVSVVLISLGLVA